MTDHTHGEQGKQACVLTNRIRAAVKASFAEAVTLGQEGKAWAEAWPDSKSRMKLNAPAENAGAAIARRDRTIMVFEEGLRCGHYGESVEFAWPRSYSLVIADQVAERAKLALP